MEVTAEHLIAGYPILAHKEYIETQNRLCISPYASISNTKVTTSEDDRVSTLYDQQVITNRTVAANKSDLMVKTEQQCFIVIPSDCNIAIKEAEKYSNTNRV